MIINVVIVSLFIIKDAECQNPMIKIESEFFTITDMYISMPVLGGWGSLIYANLFVIDRFNY